MGISGFGYLIKEGIKNVWHNRLMTVASVCVLISCLVLTGSAVLFSMNVANIVNSVGDSNETTVYLNDDVSNVEAVYIGKNLTALNNVEEAKFYSKEEAFKNYEKMLGKEIFNNMQEDNPLPHAYKVKMSDLSKYDKTVEKILKIQGVWKVSNRSETAKKLASMDRLVRVLSFSIILVLAVISLFIISNTIRATMHNRRFEISIMKSVGATNAFVRIPFVIEGMVIGFIASLLSTVAMVFLYDGILNIVSHLIRLTVIPMSNVFWYIAGAFLFAGIFIGAVSGFVSIRKYLKKEGNEILGW